MLLFTDFEIKGPEGQIILDAIATRYGYQSTIDGVDNPQTKQEFLQEWILKKTLEETSAHLTATAASVATKEKQDEIDATIKAELVVVKNHR